MGLPHVLCCYVYIRTPSVHYNGKAPLHACVIVQKVHGSKLKIIAEYTSTWVYRNTGCENVTQYGSNSTSSRLYDYLICVAIRVRSKRMYLYFQKGVFNIKVLQQLLFLLRTLTRLLIPVYYTLDVYYDTCNTTYTAKLKKWVSTYGQVSLNRNAFIYRTFPLLTFWIELQKLKKHSERRVLCIR